MKAIVTYFGCLLVLVLAALSAAHVSAAVRPGKDGANTAGTTLNANAGNWVDDAWGSPRPQSSAAEVPEFGSVQGKHRQNLLDTQGATSLPRAATVDPSGEGGNSNDVAAWLQDTDARTRSTDYTRQDALRWQQDLILVLVGLCGLGVFYLWVRVARMDAWHKARIASASQIAGVASPSDRAREVPGGPKNNEVPRPLLPQVRAIPQVNIHSRTLALLAEAINTFRRTHHGEVGYALVGKVVGQGTSRAILVNGFIDEGPRAERSAGHHVADRPWQQSELEVLQLVDPDVMYVGDAHLHPGTLDTCSGGDYETDLGNVRESRSQELVFVIATEAARHWLGRSAGCLCEAGLKLDFFYLGAASGFAYRRVVPEVVEQAALEVPAAFRQFVEADPARARLDFGSLRRLTDYSLRFSRIPLEGNEARQCVELRHRTLGFSTLIAFAADTRARPEVYVDTGNELLQYKPRFLDGGWTPQIWFTPIVLEVEREMTVLREKRCPDNGTQSGDVRPASPTTGSYGPQGAPNHGELPTVEQVARRGNPSSDCRVADNGPGPGRQP